MASSLYINKEEWFLSLGFGRCLEIIMEKERGTATNSLETYFFSFFKFKIESWNFLEDTHNQFLKKNEATSEMVTLIL